jgi:hypothetical protein
MFKCIRTAALAISLASLAWPALATTLLNLTITTALTAQVSSSRQYRQSSGLRPNSVSIQCRFTYGSGGTTFAAWVQTSLDGATWIDVYQCSGTTSSVTNVVNLSSLTAITTNYVPTDGTLAANSVKDGIIGPWWRVKYTTTGTYAGGTTLLVDIVPSGLTP